MNSFVPNVFGILFPGTVRPLEHRRFVDPEVGPRRPPVRAADAVAPVVAVGKAAARPADGAGRQAAHVIDQRLADASRVGDLRLLADPDAVVDDAAEMLDEVSVEIGRHRTDAFVEQDLDARIGRVYAAGREHDARSGRRGQVEEVSTRHGRS